MPDTIRLHPFLPQTHLTGYMPIPRQLLEMDLPSTAVLIYGALLDRGTLSQKNLYTHDGGQVYVIYPVDRLAETLHLSDTAVKRHLKELEYRGLIRRIRQKQHCPSRILLNLPADSIQATPEETKCPVEGIRNGPKKVQKVPPNNRKEQHNYSNYYQHGEEESL